MFYRKSLAVKERAKKLVALDDFSGGMNGVSGAFSAACADVCFNTEGNYGALRQGLGFDKPRLGASVFFSDAKSMACLTLDFGGGKRQYIAVVSPSGGLELYPADNPEEAVSVCGTTGNVQMMPYDYGGKRCLLFCDGSGLRLYDGANVTDCGAAIAPGSMAVYYERIFGVSAGDDRKALFSKELDPTDWTEDYSGGGYVTPMDGFGGIKALASFDDRLYLFGENAIAEAEAKAPQDDFSVKRVFAAGCGTVPGTVKVCGGGVYFLSDDGICVFDGNGVERVADLGGRITVRGDENACVYKGSYYLACRVDFGDGKRVLCEKSDYRNNALIKVSPGGSVSVSRGMDISCMSAADRLYFVSGGKIGEVTDSGCWFGAPLPKAWRTAESDLGILGKKTVTAVNVYSLRALTVKIIADGREYSLDISGGKDYRRFKTSVTGSLFRFELCTDAAEPLVVKPVFEVSYGGEEL